MDTTSPQKCLVCGITTVTASPPVCSKCRQKDADDLLKAQAFQKENPDAGLNIIAESTSIPVKTVAWHFKNGQFVHKRKKAAFLNKNKNLPISGELYGNYIWIELKGKIDSSNALNLQKYLEHLMDDGWTDFIIDMSEVTFFSSTGIRVVMSAYKRLHDLSGSIKIANPSSNVENVLGMVALDSMLL